MWQLQHPDAHNPTYLMNAKLTLSDDLKMCVPKAIVRRRTPYKDVMFAANLTPRHTVIDCHLDQSRDGIIQCVGSSKKVVIMWPATDGNLELLQEDPTHSMKFARIGNRMKGGIIVSIDSRVGLEMCTGTIHMTITMEGGPLVGINYVSAEGHCAGARCFRYEMIARLERDSSTIFTIYADQLEASLEGNNQVRHQSVLQDWAINYSLLIMMCRNLPKSTVNELRRVVRTLRNLLKRPWPLKMSCCGYVGDQFEQHFEDAHMKDLELLIEGAGKRKDRPKRNLDVVGGRETGGQGAMK